MDFLKYLQTSICSLWKDALVTLRMNRKTWTTFCYGELNTRYKIVDWSDRESPNAEDIVVNRGATVNHQSWHCSQLRGVQRVNLQLPQSTIIYVMYINLSVTSARNSSLVCDIGYPNNACSWRMFLTGYAADFAHEHEGAQELCGAFCRRTFP